MAPDQPYPPSDAGPDYAQYVELRTILDSLEIGALRFFLGNTTPEEKRKRFDELSLKLKPIIKQLWDLEGAIAIAGECPPGYFNCDGVCLPYPCM